MSAGPGIVLDGLKVQVDFGNKNTFDPVPTSLPLALDSSTSIINTALNTGNVLGNASPTSAYTYYQCYDAAKAATAGATGNTDRNVGSDVYAIGEFIIGGLNGATYFENNTLPYGPNVIKLNWFADYVADGSLVPGEIYYLRHTGRPGSPANVQYDGFFQFLSNAVTGTQTPEPNREYFFRWVASHNSAQRGQEISYNQAPLNDDFAIYSAIPVGKWGYEGYCIANEFGWSTNDPINSTAPVDGWVNIDHNQNYDVSTDPFTIEVWFRMRDLPTAEYGDGTPIYGNRQGSNYALFCYPKDANNKSSMGACYDDSRYNTNHKSVAQIGQMEWVQFVHCHTPYDGIRGSFRYYVNGELDTDLTISADSNGFSVPNTLAIGHDFRYLVQSRIDMAIIRHYDRVLLPAEIKKNFNANRGRFRL